MNILCAIPSRANHQMLDNLLTSLKTLPTPPQRTVVYDNGYDTDDGRDVLQRHGDIIDANGWRFYKMWNHAWETAHNDNYDAVALLNDDITINKHSLTEAHNVLFSDPTIGAVGLNYQRPLTETSRFKPDFLETKGTYKDGGIWGCAFLLRSATWGNVPPIDERYWLWYGDDELFINMNTHGWKCGLATNAAVLHEASTTTNMFPELRAKTVFDEQLFRSKFT